MQPSDTGRGRRRDRSACPGLARKGNASGSNSLPPRPRIQPRPIAVMHQRGTARAAAPRHRAARPSCRDDARASSSKLRIERTHAIALSIEGARLGVRARGDQIAIFGIEEEDEPEEDGEQAVVEMLRRGGCELLDALPIGRVQAAQQAREARPGPAPQAGWTLRPARRGSPSGAPADAARAHRCAGGRTRGAA